MSDNDVIVVGRGHGKSNYSQHAQLIAELAKRAGVSVEDIELALKCHPCKQPPKAADLVKNLMPFPKQDSSWEGAVNRKKKNGWRRPYKFHP